jgi:hypothetical protein
MEVISKEQPGNKTDVAWLILFEAVCTKIAIQPMYEIPSNILLGL